MTGVGSQIDVQQLLSTHDFVRRLAHSLVFDQQRVDDVVQEAWVAALRRPPRQRAAVTAWFRATLHNLARRGSRDEARRRRRERAAARPEALPSTADVLAREQQRREVVDAVLALPEPYRSTVLARWFDELEPAEIARRRGVPAATVRSQLHRALELLRQRLDGRHGDRRAWSLWLLPLARPAAPTGMTVISAAGALLMAKLLIGAGALALAVLGLLWIGERPDAPVPAGADSPVAVAPAPTQDGAPAPAVADQRVEVAAAPRPQPAALPGAAGLRGRVLHADGRPAADRLVRALGIDGIAVFAEAADHGRDRSLPLLRGETRTGADGVFTLNGLTPRARYLVDADADGPDRTLRLATVTPFPDAIGDLGDLVLAAKGSIGGRAVDEHSAPVAGAEVLALDLPAALAMMLPFDRFDPASGGMLSLPVPAAGPVDAAAQAEQVHDFLARDLFARADLDRDEDLAVLVVDRLPWLEALWRALPVARTRTAADGSFTVDAVEPGGNLLLVRKPGLATGGNSRVVVQAQQRRDVGDVVLGSGEELRGSVRDADGAAVAGAEVRVASIGGFGYRGIAFGEAPVRTDARGAFAVGGLGRGRVLVAARRSDGEPWQTLGPVASDDDVVLQLPARQSLRVHIARGDGAAPTAVELELFAGPDLHELRRAGLQQRLLQLGPVTPDADGMLALGELPDGCYTLRATAAAALPVEITLLLPQAEPPTVTLPAARRVTVRVRDEADHAIAGAKVYVRGLGAGAEGVLPSSYGLEQWTALPRFAGTTDAAGELHVDCGAATECLQVVHPTHAPRQVEVPPEQTRLDVVLARTGSIRGRLYDHGVPADPRRYCIVAQVAFTTGVPLPDLRAGLQPDGSFVFEHVPPTDYDLHAEPLTAEPLSLHRCIELIRAAVMPSWFAERPLHQTVRVACGACATAEFDVDPNQPKPGELPARVTGRALLDGVPLAGAELQRRGDDYRRIGLATVAADGSFVIDKLPSGPVRLLLWQPDGGGELWQAELTLQSGETRRLDLAMATGSLRGTATFATGLSSRGHVVVATGTCHGGVVVRHADLDAAGHFAFAALPAGDYELQASGPDGRSDTVSATITAGTAAPELQLTLQELPVLSGRIVGDFDAARAMVVLNGSNWSRGNGLDEDGHFHFADVKAEVCTLELRVGGRTLALDPGRIDLRQGGRRELLVRIAATGK